MAVDILLIPILEKIDFIRRFKQLSSQHSEFDDRLINVEPLRVKSIIEELGYKVKYIKSESFFKILDILSPYKMQFNIVIQRGLVEFIWGIEKNSERLKIGSSICGAIEQLTNQNFSRKPTFQTYEELKQILKDAFSIYEDFKREILKESVR